MQSIFVWSQVGLKLLCAGVLWFGAVPLCIGLFFELLIVIPLRVGIDETPCHYLHQDWFLGLIFLKLLSRLILFGQLDEDFAAPVENAVMDEEDMHAEQYWLREYELVKEDGVKNFRLRRCLRKIILPVLFRLLVCLAVPYVATNGILRAWGVAPLVVSACYRYSYLFCVFVAIATVASREVRCLAACAVAALKCFFIR